MALQGKLFSCFIGLLVTCGVAHGAYAPTNASNPRSTDSATSSRAAAYNNDNVSRRAVSGPTRVRVNPTRAGVTSRGALISSAVRTAAVPSTRTRVRMANAPVAVSRVARSAKTNARFGKSTILDTSNISRSAMVRATALFNDVSKIGSGYANCRESYATCMDQICGQANDTYRRCFCSDRFTQFRDIENALDKAMIMLQNFQDNNLNAVDKTAAEVNAMYSATVGEQAIKKDTSASAKMLNEINDLLSGKTSVKTSSGSGSIGVLELDFSSDMDDIWSGGGDSIFSSSGQDLSQLEGTALFSAAQKQCSRLSQGTCENDAVFSMSKSSYNILISQDCNAYEKTLNKKRETVAQAIRTAEKYLREARLEEYRSHNSADVNECVSKVRTAILQDTACGDNYKRCLDPTGAYINGATGEAIYSPRLFKLEETISLSGDVSGDVLADNPDYNRFLDNYRKYVTRELDTCREIADFVWTEFKRNAIIEIAQAQTNKIEDVKMSCVETMAECYNTQTQALIGFDQNTATAAGALGRYTARDMCREKVTACAALYGSANDNKSCEFDARGHLISDSRTCGLASLLNYVSTVDSLNVVEKCNEAIDEYVEKLCTPENDNYEFPYNCKGMSPVDDPNNNMSLPNVIKQYAAANCSDVTTNPDKDYNLLETQIKTRVDSLISDVRSGVRAVLAGICEDSEGHWYSSDNNGHAQTLTPEPPRWSVFYNRVSGRGTGDTTIEKWGVCYENTRMMQCLGYNSGDDEGEEETATTNYAIWDSTKEICTFTDSWYKKMCEQIGGYYNNEICYVGN